MHTKLKIKKIIKRIEKTLEVLDMFIVLTLGMVSWMYTYFQTYQVVRIKYVQCLVYQSYLNKNFFKKNRLKAISNSHTQKKIREFFPGEEVKNGMWKFEQKKCRKWWKGRAQTTYPFSVLFAQKVREKILSGECKLIIIVATTKIADIYWALLCTKHYAKCFRYYII